LNLVHSLQWHMRLVWLQQDYQWAAAYYDLALIGLRGCLVTRLSDISQPCLVRNCGSRDFCRMLKCEVTL
jgi:hypothetical protein